MVVPVAIGETSFEVKPSTEPTLLSIESAVGVPPESVQDNVADWPCVIIAELVVNVEITGTAGGGGLTVTVTDFVAVPLTFVAVKV